MNGNGTGEDVEDDSQRLRNRAYDYQTYIRLWCTLTSEEAQDRDRSQKRNCRTLKKKPL